MAAPSPRAETVQAGRLPPWKVVPELPAPPPYNFRNAIKLIGPGAIALGISIGSGEWLLGPTVTVKYGAGLLWIATLSILIQVVYNMEAVRYTLYTGEPIFTGFMRTAPGPTFWGWVYSILAALQIGWPGWALTAATAISAGILGRLPDAAGADRGMVLFWGYMTFIAAIVIIALGDKVERTMEYVQWFFVGWIILYLLIIGIFFAPGSSWAMVIKGFLGMGDRLLPNRGDWVFMGAFAAYAGMGGLVNGTLSNWVRDKGWGMGGVVGYIPAVVGGHKVNLSQTGSVFQLTPENLRRFNEWWKYVRADQVYVWMLGCFIGMALPAILTVTFIKPGTNPNQWGIAAMQAEAIAKVWGPAFWFLTLLNGFWILFSTQLGQTESFVRTVTDILWVGSERVRNWSGGDVRKIYYTILVLFAGLGMVLINFAPPLTLIVIGAFISGVNFVFLAAHTLYVNRKFLPEGVRPPAWRQAVLVLMMIFFGFFATLGILNSVFKIRV